MKNEIVVYQPDKTLRLEVKLENETVWLTQSQMAELFGCTTRNVRLHLENIYACGELEAEATRKDFFLVRQEGSRRVGFHGVGPHGKEMLITDCCARELGMAVVMSSPDRVGTMG